MGNRESAIALFNAGVSASQDKGHSLAIMHAYNCFSSAVYADPTWWQAPYQAGNNAFDLAKTQGRSFFTVGVACQRRALEAGPPPAERAKVLCNLGMLLYETGELEEAFSVSAEAAKLDPSLVSAWQNLSCIVGLWNRPQDAVNYARIALEKSSDAERTLSEALLSFALLFNRNLAEGYKLFECRYKWRLQHFLHMPYPDGPWQGQPNKTVFLVNDQGLGDTLSYARFVPLAAKKARYLHICVQPELLRLFQHAFVDLPNINLIPSPSPFPQADHWTAFVSLPYALGLTDDEIRNTPQIKAPRFSLPSMTWKVPDRKLHIGIAWSGSKLNDVDRHRNIPVEQFLDLYKVPGIQLYSLQVDDKKSDLNLRGCSPLIADLSGYIRDVQDTISFLDHLDLVITCESALGHIATAAGKECWVPYSFLGHDYRVSHSGEDQLWSNYRVFRQGKDCQWQPVFDQITEALREKVDGPR